MANSLFGPGRRCSRSLPEVGSAPHCNYTGARIERAQSPGAWRRSRLYIFWAMAGSIGRQKRIRRYYPNTICAFLDVGRIEDENESTVSVISTFEPRLGRRRVQRGQQW